MRCCSGEGFSASKKHTYCRASPRPSRRLSLSLHIRLSWPFLSGCCRPHRGVVHQVLFRANTPRPQKTQKSASGCLSLPGPPTATPAAIHAWYSHVCLVLPPPPDTRSVAARLSIRPCCVAPCFATYDCRVRAHAGQGLVRGVGRAVDVRVRGAQRGQPDRCHAAVARGSSKLGNRFSGGTPLIRWRPCCTKPAALCPPHSPPAHSHRPTATVLPCGYQIAFLLRARQTSCVCCRC